MEIKYCCNASIKYLVNIRVLSLLLLSCTSSKTQSFQVVSLIDTSDPISLQIASAPVVAKNTLEQNGILPINSITLQWLDSTCDIRIAADLFLSSSKNNGDKLPTAVICGICNDVCGLLAVMSNAWNMMAVSYLCNGSSLSGYETFARTNPVVTNFGPMYDAFRKANNWTNVAVIASPDSDMSAAAGIIAADLVSDSKNPAVVSYYTLSLLFNRNGLFVDSALTTIQSILRSIIPTCRSWF